MSKLQVKKFYKSSASVLNQEAPFGPLDLFKWLYPLANVAIAPAVIISQLDHSLWSYVLIASNLLLALWHLKYISTQAHQDRGHRNRYGIQLSLVVGLTLGACYMAYLQIPVTTGWVLTGIVLSIVAASVFNLTSTVSELLLPWLTAKIGIDTSIHMTPRGIPQRLPYSLKFKGDPAVALEAPQCAFQSHDEQQRAQTMMRYLWARRHKMQQKFAGTFFHASDIAECETIIGTIRTTGFTNKGDALLGDRRISKQRALQALDNLKGLIQSKTARRDLRKLRKAYFKPRLSWQRMDAPQLKIAMLEAIDTKRAKIELKIEALNQCLPKPPAKAPLSRASGTATQAHPPVSPR